MLICVGEIILAGCRFRAFSFAVKLNVRFVDLNDSNRNSGISAFWLLIFVVKRVTE